MYIKLKNGVVYDPVHGINGEKRDIYIRDGLITRKPSSNVRINQTYDMKDKIIIKEPDSYLGIGDLTLTKGYDFQNKQDSNCYENLYCSFFHL